MESGFGSHRSVNETALLPQFGLQTSAASSLKVIVRNNASRCAVSAACSALGRFATPCTKTTGMAPAPRFCLQLSLAQCGQLCYRRECNRRHLLPLRQGRDRSRHGSSPRAPTTSRPIQWNSWPLPRPRLLSQKSPAPWRLVSLEISRCSRPLLRNVLTLTGLASLGLCPAANWPSFARPRPDATRRLRQ